MDPVLSYDFSAIEHTIRQEIHSTSARFNAALDDLRAQIAPLQAVWTREAAEAYRVEQARWDRVGRGAQRDPGQARQRRARRIRRGRRDRPSRRRGVGVLAAGTQTLCGPKGRRALTGPHSHVRIIESALRSLRRAEPRSAGTLDADIAF